MDLSKVLDSKTRCTRISDGLAKVAAEFDGQLVMKASNDAGVRGALIAAANELVLVDGHHTYPGEIDELALGGRGACPRIRAPILIAGCCCSWDEEFREAVRPGLDQPVAYLGCDGFAPYEHASWTACKSPSRAVPRTGHPPRPQRRPKNTRWPGG